VEAVIVILHDLRIYTWSQPRTETFLFFFVFRWRFSDSASRSEPSLHGFLLGYSVQGAKLTTHFSLHADTKNAWSYSPFHYILSRHYLLYLYRSQCVIARYRLAYQRNTKTIRCHTCSLCRQRGQFLQIDPETQIAFSWKIVEFRSFGYSLEIWYLTVCARINLRRGVSSTNAFWAICQAPAKSGVRALRTRIAPKPTWLGNTEILRPPCVWI
jgi:hypothetical protein